MNDEALVRAGVRAAVRDLQEWLDGNTPPMVFRLSEQSLRAYLMAMLITAGGYGDGEG